MTVVMRCLIFFIFSYLALATSAEARSYKNYKAYKFQAVQESRAALLKQFQDYSDTVIFISSESAVVSPDHVASFEDALNTLEFEWTIAAEDFEQYLHHERKTRSTEEYGWKGFYDLAAVHNFIRKTAEKYPKVAKLAVAGHSYEGREVLGLVINTDFSKSKPQAYIEGTIHAREWTSTASTTFFIERLLTAKEGLLLDLKNHFEWHIFPITNPDGYHFTHTEDRLWRKSRSLSTTGCYGVDLNRNWDHNWGGGDSIKEPCEYQIYCGTGAFSEPETASVSKYILGLKNLDLFIAVHADSGLLLIPYGDSEVHIPNHDDLIKICKNATDYAYKVDKGVYDLCGTAVDVLSPASGNTIDWVKDATKASIIYNIELRPTPDAGDFSWSAASLTIITEEFVQLVLGIFAGARELGYFK